MKISLRLHHSPPCAEHRLTPAGRGRHIRGSINTFTRRAQPRPLALGPKEVGFGYWGRALGGTNCQKRQHQPSLRRKEQE